MCIGKQAAAEDEKEEEAEMKRRRRRRKKMKKKTTSVLGITGLAGSTSTVESITWVLAKESKTEATTDRKEYVCRCSVSTGDRFFLKTFHKSERMKET